MNKPARETYLSSLQQALHGIFERDLTVYILGEDILDPYGGAFKVTKGLSRKFPDRVISTPICEASIIGVATGLALRGMRAIAEIMFGDFITIAADQIVNHASKFGQMYGGGVKIPLVIRTPMGGGRGYGPVHSQCLEKMFLGVPGLLVAAPSHFHDPGSELHNAIYDERPVLFIENKLLYPRKRVPSIPVMRDHGFELVAAENYEHGARPDVVIVTYGGMSRFVEELLGEFAEEEIRVKAVLPSLLSPFTAEAGAAIVSAVAECGRVVLVEEGTEGFGWASAVAEKIYKELFNQLRAPVACVAGYPSVIPTSFELEQELIVTKTRIESAVMEVLSR